MARQLVSHRRARRGSAAPLYVLAADLCRQPRSQSCAGKLWNVDLYQVKRSAEEPHACRSGIKPSWIHENVGRLAAPGTDCGSGSIRKVVRGDGLASRENVYTRLGVKTVINCRGTWTYLSGSLQFPEVRAAQTEASHHF